MRYWENGVANAMLMDFGDFVMKAKLVELNPVRGSADARGLDREKADRMAVRANRYSAGWAIGTRYSRGKMIAPATISRQNVAKARSITPKPPVSCSQEQQSDGQPGGEAEKVADGEGTRAPLVAGVFADHRVVHRDQPEHRRDDADRDDDERQPTQPRGDVKQRREGDRQRQKNRFQRMPVDQITDRELCQRAEHINAGGDQSDQRRAGGEQDQPLRE